MGVSRLYRQPWFKCRQVLDCCEDSACCWCLSVLEYHGKFPFRSIATGKKPHIMTRNVLP